MFEVLMYIAGAILSAALELIPPLHDWYNGLSDKVQKWLVIGLSAVIGVAAAYGVCNPAIKELLASIGLVISCGALGLLELAKAILAVLFGSQSVYALALRGRRVGDRYKEAEKKPQHRDFLDPDRAKYQKD